MKEHYDVVVLGGQLAGLIAGINLAKRGYRVLLADNGEASGGYLRHGLWYPLVSQLFAVDPFDRTSSSRALMRELGLAEPESRDPDELAAAPVFQVAWQDQRLDVYAGGERGEVELARVFGADAAVVSRWQRELAERGQRARQALFAPDQNLLPASSWQQWRYRRWAHGVFAALGDGSLGRQSLPGRWADFMTAATGFAQCRAASTSSALFGAADAVTLPALWGATTALPDRHAGLVGALRHQFVEVGGTLNTSPINALVCRGSKVTEIVLDEPRLEVTAAVVVLSLYKRSLNQWLREARRAGKLLAELEKAPPLEVMWVEHVLADIACLPEGMASRVYHMIPDHGGVLARDALWIEWEHPRDTDLDLPDAQRVGRDTDRVLFSVRGLVPWSSIQRPDKAAGIRACFYQGLSRLVPFLAQHEVDRASALESGGWDKLSRPPRLQPRWHFPRYAHRPDDPLAIGGLSVVTPYTNLLRCSAETLPALGLEGQLYTANHVAERIAQTLPR